jgi:hypothetical protein
MEIRDWGRNREMWAAILEKKTGSGVDAWVRLIRDAKVENERKLRAWLAALGVTGYAQHLLVMEIFGYPDFVQRDAATLVAAQYAARPALRPIHDAVVAMADGLGDVTMQARKTYVSLVGPRRTFARLQASSRDRLDLGLRLATPPESSRLLPSTIHETMRFRIALGRVEDVDAEVGALLSAAYQESSAGPPA